MQPIALFFFNYLLLFFLDIAPCANTLVTNQLDYTYRQATLDDLEKVIALVNTEAYKDSDSIVIVPEKFRTQYFTDGIKKERIFIALCENTVIGFKKLFCIIEAKERNDILTNELHCYDEPALSVSMSIDNKCSYQSLNDLNIKKTQKTIPLKSISASYLYTGADFTHPKYRGLQINTNLTKYAFDQVLQKNLNSIAEQKTSHIALVYGLTDANAGKDVLGGRTRGIVQQFFQALARANYTISSEFFLSKYHTHKPSFDPKSMEFEPLPKNQSIHGFGHVILAKLEQGEQV